MRRIVPSAGLVLGWFCLAACWAACRPCAADVLPRVPRDVQGQLALARTAAAEGRYSEVFLLVEGLLGSGEDGFAAVAGVTGARRPIRAEATALLAALPPAQLAAWETWCGGRARDALDAAARRRDRAALIDTATRFPLTAAGDEAALLLAFDAVDRHRPQEALAWLRRLERNRGTAAPPGRQAALLQAVAHLMAGQEELARAALARLPSGGPEVQWRLGGVEAPADDPQRLLLSLAAAARPLLDLHEEPGGRWTRFGGDPARNAAGDWAGTVDRLLWRVDVRGASAAQTTGANVPSGYPVVHDALVLARSDERLIAIEPATGRQLWEYPWGGESAAGAGLGTPGQVIALRNIHPALRTATDASRGQVTADERRVFLIEGPDAVSVNVWARTGGPTHNRLLALSIRKEGKLEWSVGAESGEDEPAMAGAYFLGPPLVHGGRLYVPAELAGEIHLCVLDASTGRLAWSLLLAVPDMAIGADPQRRLAGAALSMADGVLVCPTSAGAVVAVDLAACEVLWGHSYPTVGNRTRTMQLLMLRAAGHPHQQPSGSIDAGAAIAGGRVLIAPVESDELLCLDLHSGDLVWSRAIPDFLYVGCVAGDTVVTVGRESLAAWHLRTGKPAWPELAIELPDGRKTTGRGVAAGQHYFLPVTEAEVLGVRTATGRIEHRLPLAGRQARGLGNLVAVGPLVLSQSAESIQAFATMPEPAEEPAD